MTADTTTLLSEMNVFLPLFYAGLIGYFLGSIPFGLILTRAAGQGDIRKIGSGNIGATNVLRTGNKKLAALTLILDGAKGALGMFFLEWIQPTWPFFTGIMPILVLAFFSVVGHSYPIWLRFKGGKGVATILGIFFALSWPFGLTICAIWLVMALVFRISSLAALTALASAPLLAIFFTNSNLIGLLCLLLALLSFVRHASNIRRLLAGREPRIGHS